MRQLAAGILAALSTPVHFDEIMRIVVSGQRGYPRAVGAWGQSGASMLELRRHF